MGLVVGWGSLHVFHVMVYCLSTPIEVKTNEIQLHEGLTKGLDGCYM